MLQSHPGHLREPDAIRLAAESGSGLPQSKGAAVSRPQPFPVGEEFVEEVGGGAVGGG